MVRASAPGKIILFGEHAVVYDKLGLAAAIDMRSLCAVEKASNPFLENITNTRFSEGELADIFITVEDSISKGKYSEFAGMIKADPNICVKYIMASVFQHTEFSPIKIRIKSELRKGMGTSSSVFAAAAMALSEHFQLKLTKKHISEIAYKGDIIAHGGTPSGIDNNITAYGGYISFKKSEGPKVLDISQSLPIVIADTGIIANTGSMVTRVRDLLRKDKEAAKAIEEIDCISKEALDALKSRDLAKTGHLMNKNQEHLRKLGVSTPEIEKLIEVAKSSGALGAKMTGGGGGGCIVALVDENKQDKTAEALRKCGKDVFITKTGAEGVRLEK